MSYINNPVLFNGVNLETIIGLTILMTDPYKPPKRDLLMSKLARSDKSKVSSAFYKEKRIIVRVGVTRATRALLEQSLDSLANLVQAAEKELVLLQGGSQRKYYATLGDTVLLESGGSYAEMDLVFECSDPFGYEMGATLLLAISGYTSYYRGDQLNFGGSAMWQVPVITITYTAVSGGDSKSVTIGNQQTGQAITIMRTWAAGDVITVDAFNRAVQVNGVDVDFTGAIPEWKTGIGYWYYRDTFTSRTFNGSIRCVRRYA